MSRVLGIKMVDFYITQIGASGTSGNTNIAKYVDIVCPEIPKVAQILDERHGQVLARVPLERHFSGSSSLILRDKQWKRFHQQTNYFNPISIKKLNFTINEKQDDGDYLTLKPDAKWYMILEITTVNVKVERLPDKPPDENPKKYSFGLLVAVLASILGGFMWWVNKSPVSPV
jgi:hypothetical protein